MMGGCVWLSWDLICYWPLLHHCHSYTPGALTRWACLTTPTDHTPTGVRADQDGYSWCGVGNGCLPRLRPPCCRCGVPDIYMGGEVIGSCDLVSIARQVCTGHLLAVLERHYQPIRTLCLSDDGGWLLSGGDDGRVVVWRLARYITPDHMSSQYCLAEPWLRRLTPVVTAFHTPDTCPPAVAQS